jgi:hypothetical protein
MVRSSAKSLEWSKRLERFRRAGVSLSQFCRDEQVGLQSFYYWKKRLASKVQQQNVAIVAPIQADNGSSASPVRFTVVAGAVKIECQVDSLQVIDTVLAWAARQQNSRMFHPLVVQD